MDALGYNKKKMRMFFSLFLILWTLQLISGQTEDKVGPVIVNLPVAFDKQEEVSLSRFVDKITYVPLENNPQALISQNTKIEVTDEFIIVKTGSNGDYRILLFNKSTGKFIRAIGKQGRGPGEFAIYSPLPFNPIKKEIYALSYSSDLIVYDLSGRIIDKIELLQWTHSKTKDGNTSRLGPENMLDESIFVTHIRNISGREKAKIVLFTKDRILKIFPNFLTYNGEIGPGPLQYKGNFHKWDNQLFFIEAFCDTLYQVTNESLIPRYFFNCGKFNAPYSKQNIIDRSKYFVIVDIIENRYFIFLQLFYNKSMFTGFIDKRNNKVTFCKIGKSDSSGLLDDINGLMNVVPIDFTQKNEMVYIIQPLKLITWLKDNPDKAAKAKTKLPWLNGIDEFSNPIIAIAKCKE